MSFVYDVNLKQMGNGGVLYQLMQTLISAGWVVRSSSDGTTYNSSGNQITTALRNAGGIYNAGAWFRIQAPSNPVTGQKRELCFQQGNTGNSISNQMSLRIKYSANVTGSGGFTGGSPSATQVPSATDEQVLLGDGTNASPTYITITPLDNQFACHMVADTGALGYSWWLMMVSETGSAPSGLQMAMDVMMPGTSNSSDTDPCVIYCENSGGNGWFNMFGGTGCNAYFGSISSWDNCNMQNYSTAYPSAQGSEAWSNEDCCIGGHWVRSNVPYGTKGYSSLFLVPGQPRGYMYVMQVNPNANGDHVYQRDVLLPWPPNTPVVIA